MHLRKAGAVCVGATIFAEGGDTGLTGVIMSIAGQCALEQPKQASSGCA